MKIDAGRDFGVRECPGCAVDVPQNNNRCPVCGYEFPNQSPQRRWLVWLIALGMLLLFLMRLG